MSAVGTKRTCRDVRVESAFGDKPDFTIATVWTHSGLITLDEWSGESYSARNCASRFDSRVTSMISDDCTSPAWLAGGGEMGGRMRAKDWSASPLGHPETWPQSVKTAVSICLNSRVPIALWLGPELRLIYNDAYIPFLGETKHPAMLGAPGREAWGEIWAAIEPMHDEVAAGRATSVEDVQLFFTRRLPREEVYVSWGYSPILAAEGVTIEGTFDACTETTAKAAGKGRLATLRDLGARSTEQRSAEVACRDAAEVLRANPLDIPFAAIYLLDEEGMSARRVAGTRLDNGSTVFPESHPVIHGSLVSEPWPLNRVAETSRSCQISDLPGTVGIFPAGPWPDPVESAFVLPLAADPAATRWLPDRRRESPPHARPRLPHLPRSRCRPYRHEHCGCACFRSGTQARRGAGRDRSCQNELLLQRQPRVPHPADTHDESD